MKCHHHKQFCKEMDLVKELIKEIETPSLTSVTEMRFLCKPLIAGIKEKTMLPEEVTLICWLLF